MQKYIDLIADFLAKNWQSIVVGIIVYLLIHGFRHGFKFSMKSIKNYRATVKEKNELILTKMVRSHVYREKIRMKVTYDLIMGMTYFVIIMIVRNSIVISFFTPLVFIFLLDVHKYYNLLKKAWRILMEYDDGQSDEPLEIP